VKKNRRGKEFLRDALLQQLEGCGLCPCALEVRFHPVRRWRFDLAWLDVEVACEVQGGTWLPRGGHTTGKGFANDREKMNTAQIMGVDRCRGHHGTDSLWLCCEGHQRRTSRERQRPPRDHERVRLVRGDLQRSQG